jgi:hypothetical protein
VWRAEEFGIYLNYVRKLGFEETPDYEFLRELFAKVMKNNNDIDDGVYDWNLLNGISSSHHHSRFIPTFLSFRWSRLGGHSSKFSSGHPSNLLTLTVPEQKSDALPSSEHRASSITPT